MIRIMIVLPKYFIADQLKVSDFHVINTDKNRTIIRQKLLKQPQPGVHHA